VPSTPPSPCRRPDYAPTGGAVPIRIHGTTIGVLAISGLSSDQDHDLASAALRSEIGSQDKHGLT
jgi:uncharacterized protein (UPF0303 family)